MIHKASFAEDIALSQCDGQPSWIPLESLAMRMRADASGGSHAVRQMRQLEKARRQGATPDARGRPRSGHRLRSTRPGLAHDEVGVGTLARYVLLHPTRSHFGGVEIAVIVSGKPMDAP